MFRRELTPGAVAVGFSNCSHALTHLLMLLYPTAVLGVEREFGLPYGELLSLSLPGFILFGVGALPAGWLADRWSERGMLTVMLIGMGVASILTGFAPSPFWLAAGLGLVGLFASIYHPVGISMVVRHARRRGRDLGINGVYGGVGLALGPLVAGALTDLWSWRAAFIAPGVVSILLGVAFIFLAGAARSSGRREAPAAQAAPVPTRTMVSAFVTLSLATVCTGLIFQSSSIALPKLFDQRLSFFEPGSALGVGGFVTLVYLVAACFQIVGGLLADRHPLKLVYAGAHLVQAPLLLVAASAAELPLVGVAMLMVLFQNGAAPAETALFARYSPSRWQATAFGVKFVIALGASSLGVPLVVWLYDSTGGFFWLFAVLGGLALTVAVVAVLLPGEPSPEPVPAPAARAPATAD